MKKKGTGGILASNPNTNTGRAIKSKYFPDKTDGFFIEAGAANGVAGSVCCYFKEFGWTGMNVEANENWIELLNLESPDTINVRAALWNKNGTETLILPQYKKDFKYPGGASIVMWDEEKLKKGKFIGHEKQEVTTITYHSLCKEYDIKEVDLFVLDVEGAELNVIDGVKKTSPLPHLFYIEDDKVNKHKLNKKMKNLGYKKVDSDRNNSYYLKKD